MRLIRTIFDMLSRLVYLVIVGYLLMAAPMLLGHRPVVVLSGSMEPAYHVGSLVYYKAAEFKEIQVGDSITYHAGEDALVTHRVVKINELDASFVTKGDANESEDAQPVSYKNVAGKTWEFSIPYAGYFVSYGKQMPVILGMAGIIIISVMLDSLFPVEKKKREREGTEKNEEKNKQK